MNALGGAGVLPFAALAGIAFVQVPASFDVTLAFLAYSALILSFLGGVRWGRALASGGGAGAFALSVLPSLWAWPAVAWLPPLAACGWLALGFALQGALDVVWDRSGPPGFRRLRAALSLAVLACHGLFALALALRGAPA